MCKDGVPCLVQDADGAVAMHALNRDQGNLGRVLTFSKAMPMHLKYSFAMS